MRCCVDELMSWRVTQVYKEANRTGRVKWRVIWRIKKGIIKKHEKWNRIPVMSEDTILRINMMRLNGSLKIMKASDDQTV